MSRLRLASLLRAGAIDEADIAVEGLEAAVAALERLTQMLAYNCREEVTFGLRVRLCTSGVVNPRSCIRRAPTWCCACCACLIELPCTGAAPLCDVQDAA